MNIDEYMDRCIDATDAMKKVCSKKLCAAHLVKGARILSVKLDPDNRAVTVDMSGYPDKSGGILFAKFMMPGVEAVMFLEDGMPDMLYLKQGSIWTSNCQRRRGRE